MTNTDFDAKIKSHFYDLYSLAIADNVFDTTELEMLYKIASERNIPSEAIDEIIKNPVNEVNIVPESLNEKIEYLYDFARLIWSDGIIEESEKTALEKFCIQFGFLDENSKGIAEFLIEQVKNKKSTDEVISIVNQNL